MIYLYTLGGAFLYIFYVWFKFSNQQDSGDTKMTLKEWFHDQRQEFAATFIGAIVFMVAGEGLVDSSCDLIVFFFGEKYQDICVSIQVNLEELIYILGGASFSSILLALVKVAKKKAKAKLDSL